MQFDQSFTQSTKWNLYSFLSMLILFYQFTLYTKSACILVHGTWATNEKWYRPSGDFFEAIQACNQELNLVDEIVSFTWSGKLGYLEHLEAGKKLAEFIEPYEWVLLVAHSHGATIGMIASQEIFKTTPDRNNLAKIKEFYALGVPVQEPDINPNMSIIQRFYNLFSFGDMVQTINGACGRVFAQTPLLFNISVQLNNQHPSHSELHHPAIGQQLLKISDCFAQKKLGNFDQCVAHYPGMIHFHSYKLPRYEIQHDQAQLIQTDKDALRLMTLALFRGQCYRESEFCSDE